MNVQIDDPAQEQPITPGHRAHWDEGEPLERDAGKGSKEEGQGGRQREIRNL